MEAHKPAPPTSFRIRSPEAHDGNRVGEIQVIAWQTAYRGQIPDAVLDGLDLPAFRARWIERFSTAPALQPEPSPLPPLPHGHLVLEQDGQVRGYVSYGPYRDDDLAPGIGEIYALYLEPPAWGLGLSRPLLDRALEILGDAGAAAIVLWVLRTNVRARKFYERAGFRPDAGAKIIQLHGAMLDEVRYRLDGPPIQANSPIQTQPERR